MPATNGGFGRMSYLLDTNVCVDVLKGHPKVCARLEDWRAETPAG